MLTVDSISFNGKIRYLGGSPYSADWIPVLEIGENKASKELIEFAKKSKFINKLKEEGDIFVHHHKEIFPTKENLPKQIKKGISKIFSSKKRENQNVVKKIGKDHLSIFFETKKGINKNDTELCAINMTLPILKYTSPDLGRFEKILNKFSGIKELREKANKLFPDNKHKLTLLPYNESNGWCEFWTGEKSPFDTLDRLHIAILEELKDATEKALQKIKR